MNFPVALQQARKALFDAQAQTVALEPELMERLRQHAGEERFAKMVADTDAIRATIPALQAAYDELAAQACHRCQGTGEYSGASRYHRFGKKYCFACSGKGR